MVLGSMMVWHGIDQLTLEHPIRARERGSAKKTVLGKILCIDRTAVHMSIQ